MGSRGISGISKSSMSAKCRCIAMARPGIAVWEESGIRTLVRMAVISASTVRLFWLARCCRRWSSWGSSWFKVMFVITAVLRKGQA